MMYHFSDDLLIVENMFEQFQFKYVEDISSLQDSIEEKDFQTLTMKAHSIKGSFSTLFCKKGQELSFDLEKLGQIESLEGAQVLLDQIRDISENLIDEYREFINQNRIN